jgi:hypothetical protein
LFERFPPLTIFRKITLLVESLQRSQAMQELNPYFNQIEELQGRTEALRGYL